MPDLSYNEYQGLKNELVTTVISEVLPQARRQTIAVFLLLTTVMGLGGRAFIQNMFENELDKLSQRYEERIGLLTIDVNAEIREAQRQSLSAELASQDVIKRTENSLALTENLVTETKTNVDTILMEVDRARKETEIAYNEFLQNEKLIEFIANSYTSEMGMLLYSRDQVLGELTHLRDRLEALARMQDVVHRDTASESHKPLSWGQRKIIVLRRQSPDSQGAVSSEAEWRQSQLSSNVRISLARRGFEVEEWSVRYDNVESEISSLLVQGAPVPKFDKNAPLLLAHTEFESSDGDVAAYLLTQEGLSNLAAISSDEFYPSENYRGSFSEAQSTQPKFEIDEIAVLYLPLEG